MAPQAPGGSGRRTGLLVGGSVAAVVVVAGGILGGMALLDRGGSNGTANPDPRRAVAKAVTSEPSEAWSWTRPDDGYTEVMTSGDVIVASTGSDSTEGIVRLSADGEEMWENTSALGVSHIDAETNRIYAYTHWDGPGLVVLDAGTGEEVWDTPDWSYSGIVDGTVIGYQWDEDLEENGYAGFSSSGEELWSTSDEVTHKDGSVYRTTSDSLARLDPGDGEEMWETTFDLYLDEDYSYYSVAINDDIVAVSGTSEVVGFDPETGEERWREEDLYDYDAVTPFGSTLVSMTLSGDEENWEDGEVILFDRDGIAQRKQLDPDEYYFDGTPFIQGGTTYIDIASEQMVYDEALKPVASYDGTILPAGDGYYQLLNGELSYHLLEGGEEWSRQVSENNEESGAHLKAISGLVLVVDEDTVTAYQ